MALIIGVTGLMALGQASASAQQIYSVNVTNVAAVGAIKSAFLQVRVDVTLHSATGTAAKQKIKEAFTKDVEAANAADMAYSNGDPAGDEATIQSLLTAWSEYASIATTELIPLSEQGDMSAWQTVQTSEANPRITKVHENIDALNAAEAHDARHSASEARADYRSSRLTSVLPLVVGLVVALMAGFLVARQIERSLGRVQEVCTRAAMTRSSAAPSTSTVPTSNPTRRSARRSSTAAPLWSRSRAEREC